MWNGLLTAEHRRTRSGRGRRPRGVRSQTARLHLRRRTMTKVLEKSPPGNTHESNGTASQHPAEPPRRILIVEDNDQARHKLQQLLQVDPQFEVDATGDG